MSNVCGSERKYIPRNPSSMKIEPKIVYRKNLMAAYSRLAEPQMPIRKYIGTSTSSQNTKNRIRSNAMKVPAIPVSSSSISDDERLGAPGLRDEPPRVDGAQERQQERQDVQRHRHPVDPHVVAGTDRGDPVDVELELESGCRAVVEAERDRHANTNAAPVTRIPSIRAGLSLPFGNRATTSAPDQRQACRDRDGGVLPGHTLSRFMPSPVFMAERTRWSARSPRRTAARRTTARCRSAGTAGTLRRRSHLRRSRSRTRPPRCGRSS